MIWFERSRTRLATLQEGSSTVIDLPVDSGAETVLISGSLPTGLELQSNSIVGTPVEVPRETEFRFVLRATLNSDFEDRTFNILIQGADAPEWQTPEGLLPVGVSENFFILDSSPIDYQLSATDSDIQAGQELKYFIANGDGELPPGVTLTEQGRLIGVVDPILALEKEAAKGFFDENRYDRYPYDFAIKSTLGFDSFFYDSNIYDLVEPTRPPKKLNRFYEFRVSVSDGDTISKRTFRIFVVGDDFLRADNTIMQVGTGIFTADNTFVRTPVWLTPGELGFKRANNFITIFLDVLDTNTIPGILEYELLSKNPDGTRSSLPPGTEIDRLTGEIFGRVPYQPAITKEYTFTVRARRIFATTGILALQQFAVEEAEENATEIKINKIGDVAQKAVGLSFTKGTIAYEVISISTFDSRFDVITISQPLASSINEGETVDLGRISIGETETAVSDKTFTINLLGEIDSTIQWLTDFDLGSVSSNYISTLSVKAETTVPNSFLLYNIESGELPPGLELAFNGEIIGQIQNEQIAEDTNYEFSVKARDQYGFSAITGTFKLTVKNTDDIVYSDIYYRPLLTQEQRTVFRRFISDNAVFQPQWIYRPNDPRFGIQENINILAYAGIEQQEIQEYVAGIARFAKRRRFRVGEVKKAIARIPGTRTDVYEVVYLELNDIQEKSSQTVRKVETGSNKTITVDSIRTTPKDQNYDTEISSFVYIGQRFNSENKLYYVDKIFIDTRTGLEEVDLIGDFSIESREGEFTVDFVKGTATNIFYRPDNENTIRADSNIVKVSDPILDTLYVSSNINLRDELRILGKTDREFLPLWMRTSQPGQAQEIGYTLSIPLAYCIPGTADNVVAAIKASGLDFQNIDIEVDRFVINGTEEYSEEKYIIFGGYDYIV